MSPLRLFAFFACLHLVTSSTHNCWAQTVKTTAAAIPAGLQPIGGNWFVKAGAKPVYYYRDAERMLDLFSYHTQDSNQDGIDNICVKHDSNFLIIESQGYPNSDPARGYHYHVTPGRFPYIMGGYAGVVERFNNRGFGRATEGALIDNTQLGENRMDKVIAAVRPGLALRGHKHAIQVELAPDKAQRRQLPTEAPSWAQIGPFEAKKITRDGNVVTLEIEIPQDASVGIFLDCHLEFANAQGRVGPITYKLNDAFRVVDK